MLNVIQQRWFYRPLICACVQEADAFTDRRWVMYMWTHACTQTHTHKLRTNLSTSLFLFFFTANVNLNVYNWKTEHLTDAAGRDDPHFIAAASQRSGCFQPYKEKKQLCCRNISSSTQDTYRDGNKDRKCHRRATGSHPSQSLCRLPHICHRTIDSLFLN